MMINKIPIVLFLAASLSLPFPLTIRAEEAILDISGTYTRKTGNESAQINISLLPGGKVRVAGMAFWGTQREYGPNIGDLDFTTVLINNHVRYSEKKGKTLTYALDLTFIETGLTAKEEGSSDNFGLNVSFAGDYKKTGP
jgi:hypothetical protein